MNALQMGQDSSDQTRPRGYKNFMLHSAEHKMFPAHKCYKMPTFVGILRYMSRMDSILGLSDADKS